MAFTVGLIDSLVWENEQRLSRCRYFMYTARVISPTAGSMGIKHHYIMGGVYYSGTGVLTITNSEINENTALFGGGMTLVSGSLIMNGSTVSKNNTSSSGAGIETYVNTTINNSTISGNQSANGMTGGLFIGGTSTGSMNNSTVVFNATDYFFGSGGVYLEGNSTFTIRNSIVAGNRNTPTFSQDCKGTFIADDYNLGAGQYNLYVDHRHP